MIAKIDVHIVIILLLSGCAPCVTMNVITVPIAMEMPIIAKILYLGFCKDEIVERVILNASHDATSAGLVTFVSSFSSSP